MDQLRQARATWAGNLAEGRGTVAAATSGAFPELPTTWASRTESSDGRTSPEELLAAAHASCFSMAFSNELSKAGHVPDRVEVTATITFHKTERWTVVGSHLEAHGWVPGITAEQFGEIAELAKVGCPISRALNPSIELTVDATLES